MREGFITMIFISFVVMLAIDAYAFKGIKLLTKNLESSTLRQTFHFTYWSITIIVMIIMFIVFTNFEYANKVKSYLVPFGTMAIIIMHVVPKLVFIAFHLVEDIGFLGIWGYKKVIPSAGEGNEIISRSTFLTKIGLTLASAQLAGFAYGIAKGRYDFRIEKEIISFENLPKEFHGLKVAQISDIHIGSFFDNKDAVKKGVELVNSLNADLILFTGDLVNNYAWELDGMIDTLKELKAPMGMFAVLGNHDYGDYVRWNSEKEKKQNLSDLLTKQEEIGFRVLMNETVKLEKNGATIDLIGIENWGKGRFAKYGDLEKAINGSSDENFQILMSHDPSHWDEEVLTKTNIDLALAGHTHGMQFGIEIAGLKWSPVKYRYPRWGGLYSEGNQHLYVNRGFGYIGFPGRVGMPPEITLIEFHKKV